METTDIVEVKTDTTVAPSVLDAPPRLMVNQVTEMANVLKDVIEQQKMFQQIGPNKYVTAEGWATLGTMLGILPVEKSVAKTENGYEAYINLVNNKTGAIIGGASSICTRDEKRWAKADDYAVRSMAITRATGKAYRLAFSWIVTMAGYKGTPAEEMPQDIEPEVFDQTNKAHLDRLGKYLENRSIPNKYWDDIAVKMNGMAISKPNIELTIGATVKED